MTRGESPRAAAANEAFAHRRNVVVYRGGDALGDKLLASTFTMILNDHGINAVLDEETIHDLVVCPRFDDHAHRGWRRYWFNYAPEGEYTPGGIMRRALDNFSRQFGLGEMAVTRRVANVRYYDIPEVPGVDVTLCSQTGNWSPYRNWPHFDELKAALTARGVSYCDLSQEQKRGVECLNHIRKSRLYVGLETGLSHYASSVANGKGLIIQSGFSLFDFWCLYDYECVSHPTSCRPCFLRGGCPRGHACMREIRVSTVLNRILARLGAE